MGLEEEWKSVYEEQSARLTRAVTALGSAVGSNVNVDVFPYLRLTLELLQSHHDSLCAIRTQLAEMTNSITAIEDRLRTMEEKAALNRSET